MTAGELLREDFELAQMGPRVVQNWDSFLSCGASGCVSVDAGTATGQSAARQRVETALLALGPGLADFALRCCCHLEWLEPAERRMGWFGWSGKNVLRIALQHLSPNYKQDCRKYGPLFD